MNWNQLKQQLTPYKQQALQRFQALSPRERHLLLALGVLIVFILFYQFIYSPLVVGIEKYHQNIINDQELLVFMQNASPRIKAARGEFKPEQVLTPDLLLPTIENTLIANKLMDFVSELSLGESSQVNVQFKEVNFDQLLIWLVEMRIKYNIQVQQFTAIPVATPGMSNVNMQLILAK